MAIRTAFRLISGLDQAGRMGRTLGHTKEPAETLLLDAILIPDLNPDPRSAIKCRGSLCGELGRAEFRRGLVHEVSSSRRRLSDGSTSP